MSVPLDIFFWSMEAAYLIHCFDEAFAGDGFVNMIKKHFWSDFDETKFFWFNTMLHMINATSIILFEYFGGSWVIFPLSICWLFVTNGFWHVLGTAKFKEYSPGLATSPLYWIVMYLIIRYSLMQGEINPLDFIISAIIGSLITVAMIGSLFIRRRQMQGIKS